MAQLVDEVKTVRPRTRRRRRRRILWFVLVSVLVLCVIAGGVWLLVFLTNSRAADERGAAAAAAVQQYVEAVAAGDAAAALSHVQGNPAPAGLLTNDALAASRAVAAITDVRAAAHPFWDTNGQIAVTYTLGDTPVSETYDVADPEEDGTYVISDTSHLTFGQRFSGLALTLNGAPVTGDSVAVFPGSYAVGVTTQPYAIVGAAPVTVTAEGETSVPTAIQPSLTDAGVQSYRTAVSAAIAGCLASRALASGCGLDLQPTLSDGTTLYDGTVFRALTPDAQTALSSLVPELDPTDATMAVSGVIGGVTTAANCTQGGTNGECDIRDAPVLQNAEVDMVQTPLAVVWK